MWSVASWACGGRLGPGCPREETQAEREGNLLKVLQTTGQRGAPPTLCPGPWLRHRKGGSRGGLGSCRSTVVAMTESHLGSS